MAMLPRRWPEREAVRPRRQTWKDVSVKRALVYVITACDVRADELRAWPQRITMRRNATGREMC